MAERRITKDRLIGEVLKEYPDTIRVFRKHFGKSCFDCPGQNHEDIEFGSVMHNADMDVVLDELNEIADKGRRK